MAYELDPSLPLEEAVRRVMEAQRAAAQAALAGADRAAGVHEARKVSKRCRALLRLVDGPEGEIARLRELGRLLSGERDAEVVRSVWAEVFGGGAPEGLTAPIEAAAPGGEVEAAPVRAEAPIEAAATGGVVAAAQALLGEPFGRVEVEPDAVVEGLVRGYRRARAAMPEVEQGATMPPVDDVHRWRRRVKDHLFQLKLVERRWPGPWGAWVAEVDALGDMLGEHHDLSLLHARLAALGELTPARAAAVEAQMAGRWGCARLLGERLFALKPRALRPLVEAVVG
jgi:hypothetical protein